MWCPFPTWLQRSTDRQKGNQAKKCNIFISNVRERNIVQSIKCTKKGNSYVRRDRSKPPRRRGQFGFYRVKTIDFAEKLNFWECKGSFILSAVVVNASHFLTYSGETPTITTSGRYVSKCSQQFYLKWYYFGFAKRLCMLKRTNKNVTS